MCEHVFYTHSWSKEESGKMKRKKHQKSELAEENMKHADESCEKVATVRELHGHYTKQIFFEILTPYILDIGVEMNYRIFYESCLHIKNE